MCFCARSLVSCQPHLLTLSNVSLKSSSALRLLEFLARKTSLWWAGTTLAWLWQTLPERLPVQNYFDSWVRGAILYTHTPGPFFPLCQYLQSSSLLLLVIGHNQSCVHRLQSMIWCSGALTTNPLSFLEIKGIVKQENGEGDKTNFVLENRQTFPNN